MAKSRPVSPSVALVQVALQPPGPERSKAGLMLRKNGRICRTTGMAKVVMETLGWVTVGYGSINVTKLRS